MTTDLALLGLMRLVSPALPVGGFAYSQGFEYAVEAGWIRNAQQTEDWLQGVISEGFTYLDIPLLYQLSKACGDTALFTEWNQRVYACRETKELRKEERQMGKALWRLLTDLNETLTPLQQPTWLAAFAQAGQCWQLSHRQICLGFLWTWLENQLTVATKTVPIGQTQVQRISTTLLPAMVTAVEQGMALPVADISGGLPGWVIASMKHENQYSRLFRS